MEELRQVIAFIKGAFTIARSCVRTGIWLVSKVWHLCHIYVINSFPFMQYEGETITLAVAMTAWVGWLYLLLRHENGAKKLLEELSAGIAPVGEKMAATWGWWWPFSFTIGLLFWPLGFILRTPAATTWVVAIAVANAAVCRHITSLGGGWIGWPLAVLAPLTIFLFLKGNLKTEKISEILKKILPKKRNGKSKTKCRPRPRPSPPSSSCHKAPRPRPRPRPIRN